ncbi:MAG: AzlC family ABC transporter permease [Actinomycetota bacterium]|nr:AzlC family ABC transporter permease [Actinomycetota bacterium]
MTDQTEPTSRAEGRSSLRAGAKAGLPFAIAAFLLAVSYGVLAEPVLGGAVTLATSAFVFAGSAQFGSVAVLGSGGGVSPAVITAVLLNARYVPMGVALAPSLRGRWWRRAAYGEAMIDASWAMASRGGGRYDPDFLVGATLPSYPAWVAGTAIGVFAGDLIGDPAALGLDALFPAFFLALLVGGELREGRLPVIVALLGAAIGLALTPVTPAGVPVIAASAAALLGLRRAAAQSDKLKPSIEGDPVG